MKKEVLILGTTPAGIQAASDLADFGLFVNLVESGPFIGEILGDGYQPHLNNTRLLEILKHPRIKVWTNSEVLNLEKVAGGFQVDLNQSPRYIDLEKCTACGDCLEVCPITIPGTDLKAIYFGGQPDCAVIAKAGVSPCSNVCRAGIHVQGYVALVGQARYREAYDLIHDALPFPSVCGRVCNHLCETACTRGQLDQAVNIMALKHYLADWAFDHQEENDGDPPPEREPTGKKVAIIGAGPAGLTAARDLARMGHEVKIFDANPEPGGMMRVGIPPHRVSHEQLSWEIEGILAEGIDLKLNTWVDDIPGLMDDGFDAVLAAAGAVVALKPDIKNADHKDNWLSLDFLKRVSFGKGDKLTGRTVIVLGGGDVALDAARSALRLGVDEVKVLCRGIRASDHELQATIEEGIEIIKGRVFKEISLDKKKIEGVLCLEAEVGDVVDGKRQFKELEGTEHLIPGDLVIWALGQKIDPSFLPLDKGLIRDNGREVQTDDRLMTPLEGLFAAGDFRLGNTTFVVDAVGEGHRAAHSIHNYLMGQTSEHGKDREQVILSQEEMEYRLDNIEKAHQARKSIPSLPVNDRLNNFQLVDLALSEKGALQEAGRCLACGPCSECMACVEICEPGAVIHNQKASTWSIHVSAVIAADDLSLPASRQDLIIMAAPDPLAGSASAYQVMEKDGFINKILFDGYEPADRVGENKTGLIVCQCGEEISSLVDTAGICKEALSWPEIDYAKELPFSCTADGAAVIRRIARENNLERIILAACSCCSLDQICHSCTYQRLRCKENLGIFRSLVRSLPIEFVNIREQCAWAHPRNKKKTTAAARVLIRSALVRVPGGKNGKPDPSAIPNSILIVGNGASAKYCQDSLAKLGLVSDIAEVMAGEIIRVGGHYRADWPDGSYRTDCLVLAPGSGAELDHISKSLLLSNQRLLMSGTRMSLDTVDYGLVICSPELPPEVSGTGAAARIKAWISKVSSSVKQPAAEVDPKRCRSCGTCQDICGFGIPEVIKVGEISSAYINPLLCFDCGICTAHCPSGAIIPGTQQDNELEHILERILV
ncbi:MAG: FAD-dependent oxidoreductase [Anaerolineales bacterium]